MYKSHITLYRLHLNALTYINRTQIILYRFVYKLKFWEFSQINQRNSLKLEGKL